MLRTFQSCFEKVTGHKKQDLHALNEQKMAKASPHSKWCNTSVVLTFPRSVSFGFPRSLSIPMMAREGALLNYFLIPKGWPLVKLCPGLVLNPDPSNVPSPACPNHRRQLWGCCCWGRIGHRRPTQSGFHPGERGVAVIKKHSSPI